MKITRLKDKLLFSAVAISMVVTLAFMLAVSWVVGRQYLTQSDTLLHKASRIINDNLEERKDSLLNAARQVATQKNLGSTIWYLAQYARSNLDRETLFNTYQQLVKDTYKTGRVAKLSRIAIYDASGNLVSFALFDKSGEKVGFVERFSAPSIQVSTLHDGEELNSKNLKASPPLAGLGLMFSGKLPRAEDVHYAMLDGSLAIESDVPIIGETFDPATGKQQIRQVGVVTAVQKLDQSFVGSISRLTGLKINVFSRQGFAGGEVATYQNPDWGGLQQTRATAFNEITIDGNGYYQCLMPFYNGNRLVGTIAALHSKEVVSNNIREMLGTLGLIAAASLLFISPFAWYFATSISHPLTLLSRIFRGVAENRESGVPGEAHSRLEEETRRSDELGDLTRSFVAMNDAINQKLREIREINASLEHKVEERTAALAAREQETRTLIENSPDTIARYDLDCRRIYVNPAFGAMFQGGVAELLGKKPTEVPGGSNAAIYEEKIREVLATGENAQFELTWTDKDHHEVCSHLRLTPERDLSGNIVSVLSVGRDITALNESRNSLNDANAKLEAMNQQLQSLATSDSLTNLPNRRLLMTQLRHALASCTRTRQTGALLFIDLDNFKTINDTLGHDSGDLLLQQVAQRLETCMREGDTVARVGGDEFVVMLESLSEDPLEAAAHAEAVGNKILASLNQPFRLAACDCNSTPSIGITLFNHQKQSIEELLKQADIAMYQSKKIGRNTLHFFDPKMQETIDARAVIEKELRHALENDQFHLHYQIQVDSLRRPLGAEALIRWEHPTRGLVAPAEFIPIAEETGLILPIGRWVLETACSQIKAWEQDSRTSDLILAVNVSAKQFRQADFVAQVRSAVQTHAIDPARLKLELTESLLLINSDDTVATMREIKEIGVRLSLDDFGTGYSSMQYLKQLPLDQLKIDRLFVRDIVIDNSDRVIVSTIIAMAQSLGLDVIAEGVETEAQRQLLLECGCHHFQGYLFGKPIPVAKFAAALPPNRPHPELAID